MRLCDRDIEAWLDEGRLAINPRPPVERINGATVDVRLGNKFRTFRGHTAPFIDLSGPKAEVSAALDRVMSEEIVLPATNMIAVAASADATRILFRIVSSCLFINRYRYGANYS